ncbi:hypothetical protein HZA40_00315 [Candidatus Peregrinibacteria bacterium]|nr:hypothetical protein [Candidatus Peregrinibacteria bacterium]
MSNELPDRPKIVTRPKSLPGNGEIFVNAVKSRVAVGNNVAKDASGSSETLAPGVTVRRDAALIFYKVIEGDTLSGIKQKLSKIPEFAYLRTLPAVGLRSFNIPPKVLQLGKFIPLPPKESPMKNLDESTFVENCRAALLEMKQNKIYGPAVKDLLLKISEREVLAMMLALAKVECGGDIAQFATFRYEKSHHVFSYSVFHVLMEGAGLKARKNLNMSLGQTEYPKNAAKLFLAFLIEKSKGKLAGRLPLAGNYENFATFYNGRNWPKSNPHYPLRLKKYYEQALKLIKA